MSINKINDISVSTEQSIKRKTAYALPDRPSESGMRATDIKKAFYSAITDDKDSIISELKRIIAESNLIIKSLNKDIGDKQKEIIDSEEIVIDKTTNKLSLSDTISNKIKNSLVTPTLPPSETQLIGVDTTNSQTMLGIGDGLSVKGDKLIVISNGSSSSNTSLPVGSIFTSALPQTDAGVHLLDGSVISVDGIYAEFVNIFKAFVDAGYNLTCTQEEYDNDVSATGSCGKFVLDETNNSLRLPKITTFIQGLTDLSNIGSAVEAGLPNIEGHLDPSYSNVGVYWNKGATTGAFQVDEPIQQGYSVSISKSGQLYRGVSMDASRSSEIYGNSDTVQPPSVQYPYYIVLANTTKTNVQVNIDNVVSELNNLSNEVNNLSSEVNNLSNEVNNLSDKQNKGTLHATKAVGAGITFSFSDENDYEILFSGEITTQGGNLLINHSFICKIDRGSLGIAIVIDNVSYQIEETSNDEYATCSCPAIIKDIPAGNHSVEMKIFGNPDTAVTLTLAPYTTCALAIVEL